MIRQISRELFWTTLLSEGAEAAAGLPEKPSSPPHTLDLIIAAAARRYAHMPSGAVSYRVGPG